MLGRARSYPDQLIVGVDPVAEAMAEASRRAAARSSRGGLENALFIQASLETIDLPAIADAVTVNYPWGTLLRAVALPDPAQLVRIASLMKPGATLDILVNATPLRDARLADRLAPSGSTLLRDEARFRAAYAAIGLAVRVLAPYPGPTSSTRWGKKLAHSGREIIHIGAGKVSLAHT